MVEAGGVEPPSENRSTRLSTRLVVLLDLPRDSPDDRIVLWQLFGYASDYRALIRDVGCCVTPKPKPQRSSGGRAALRQLKRNRYDQRLILKLPGIIEFRQDSACLTNLTIPVETFTPPCKKRPFRHPVVFVFPPPSAGEKRLCQ